MRWPIGAKLAESALQHLLALIETHGDDAQSDLLEVSPMRSKISQPKQAVGGVSRPENHHDDVSPKRGEIDFTAPQGSDFKVQGFAEEIRAAEDHPRFVV